MNLINTLNFNSRVKLIRKRGFTVTEVIMVVALIVIISAISVNVFYSFREKKALDKDVDSIVSTIEKTKNMSLNRKNDSSYGLYFASSSITVFSGNSHLTGNNILKYDLESIVKISTTSLSFNATEIGFAKVTGLPNATGTIVLSTPSYSKTITVYGTGLIEVK